MKIKIEKDRDKFKVTVKYSKSIFKKHTYFVDRSELFSLIRSVFRLEKENVQD